MDLSPTAVIVLGLLEFGEATPYDLKVRMAGSVGNFWSVPHSALYAEPERLARPGLVEERREAGGRRRRTFSITDAGRRALDAWRAEPTGEPAELRDPALLKLFFGADPRALAAEQLPAHEARLARYEEIRTRADGTAPTGPFLALDAGIRHEREWIAFWRGLA
jgi:PadR family transcriptional regulator, regulatory protein AphA